MNLKDFSLLKEDDESYTVGHPKGKSMRVPKRGMSDTAQKLVSQLKREQKFAEGTPEGTDESLPYGLGGNQPYGVPPQALAMNQVPMNQPGAQQPPQDLSVIQSPVLAEKMGAPAPEEPEAAQPKLPEAPQSPEQAPQNPLLGGQDEMNKELQTAGQLYGQAAKAQEAAGQATARAYQQAAQQEQKAQEDFQNRVKEYHAKDEQFQKMFSDQNVDPNRYWNNLDTGSKITAGISMILGGIGSGISGGPNLAMEQINRAINNDISSQMNAQNKSMNLWKMNREALGSDTQATLATQNQLLSLAKSKALSASAMAQGPEAKARMSQAILGIDGQIAQNNRTRALMDMGQQHGQEQGGLTKTDPALFVNQVIQDPKQRSEAFKEIGAMKQAVKLKRDMVQSFNDLKNRAFGGAFSPSDRESAKTAYAGIIAKLSEGRFNLEESKLQMDALLPGRFDNEETLRNKMSRLNNFFDGLVETPTLSGNNIPVEHFASTSLKSVDNSHLPGSVISTGGKKYRVAGDGNTLEPL